MHGKILTFLASALLIATLPLTAFSLDIEAATITQINIEGLKKTSEPFIRRELLFSEGEFFDEAYVKESLARLRNLNLFSKVESKVQLLDKQSNSLAITITLAEKWTTIPIVKFSSGGDASQLTVGVYDVNLFGKFIEAGVQYEKLGDTNSGTVWFRNPRLFSSRLELLMFVSSVNRLRTKYNPEAEDPEIIDGFLQERKLVSIALEKEWYWWLKLGLTIEYNDDTFSLDFLDEETKQIATTSGKGLPPETKLMLYGLSLKLGRINNQSNYLESGQQLTLTYKSAVLMDSPLEDFYQFQAKGEYKKILPFKSNFALRVLSGATDTNVIQYWNYLGGLDRIRGFVDNRFASKYYWLANVEFRIPSLVFDNFVLQHTFFYDAVSIAEGGFDELDEVSGASVGTGLRFIMPKIYRLTGRLDYAKTTTKSDDAAISFGFQQFF